MNYPEHPEETAVVRRGVHHLVEGALVVYLFAMWETYLPEDVNEWLTQDELRSLRAYQHVRDSVAHGIGGARATFPTRRAAFEAQIPFDGVVLEASSDTLDLSSASVSLGCLGLMRDLTKKLVVRFHQGTKP